jgi:hypothetical protein
VSKPTVVQPLGIGGDLDLCLWEMLCRPNNKDFPRWVTSRRYAKTSPELLRLVRLGLLVWDSVGDRLNVYAKVTPDGIEHLRRLGYKIPKD